VKARNIFASHGGNLTPVYHYTDVSGCLGGSYTLIKSGIIFYKVSQSFTRCTEATSNLWI